MKALSMIVYIAAWQPFPGDDLLWRASDGTPSPFPGSLHKEIPMNRGLTLIIVGVLVLIGAVVLMTSWPGTMTGPDNTPARVDEVPKAPTPP